MLKLQQPPQYKQADPRNLNYPTVWNVWKYFRASWRPVQSRNNLLRFLQKSLLIISERNRNFDWANSLQNQCFTTENYIQYRKNNHTITITKEALTESTLIRIAVQSRVATNAFIREKKAESWIYFTTCYSAKLRAKRNSRSSAISINGI